MPDDPTRRAERGLYAHWSAQCAYITGGETDERDGLLVTATNLRDPTLNVGFVTREPAQPDETLDWVEAWFAARGLRPGIELRAEAFPGVESRLAARGYQVVVRRPAMTLQPIAVRSAGNDPRIEVRPVADDVDLVSFQAVQAAVFDIEPDVARAFLPSRALATPGIVFLLATYGGVACATAITTMSEHGAGVVGVGTLPAYRRRGVARAVTTAAVHEGRDRGADLAWLYPSAMARPLYAGLGFRAHADAQVWVAPGVTQGDPRPRDQQPMQIWSNGLPPSTQTSTSV
jgi:GNAT superfamily N-acetyltransferase